MAEQRTPAPLPEPDPAQRPARLALYLGAGLVGAGAVVMFLGYQGVATNAVPQAQTPFVVSGGLLGVALMVLGGIGLATHVLLQVTADFRSEMGQMRESMERLADGISHVAFGTVAKGSPSSNGVVMVSQGSSSYHRADCRLVVAGEHVRPLPRAEAEETGLIPCRICRP